MVLYGLVRSFQFHKGTIKPHGCTVAPLVPSYFNSIKVRLNPRVANCLQPVFLFQFHKGTIKPTLLQRCVARHEEFQFHKGTIKPIALATRRL